jgi:hypothetical protein
MKVQAKAPAPPQPKLGAAVPKPTQAITAPPKQVPAKPPAHLGGSVDVHG